MYEKKEPKNILVPVSAMTQLKIILFKSRNKNKNNIMNRIIAMYFTILESYAVNLMLMCKLFVYAYILLCVIVFELVDVELTYVCRNLTQLLYIMENVTETRLNVLYLKKTDLH